jgi:isocitrate dehydrogenase
MTGADVPESTPLIPVTVIPGDGIGPEVVAATQRVLEAVGAPLAWDTQAAGAEVFKAGLASGVPAETVASIQRTRLVLKGPLETPVGFGEKSANVTLRKLFETFANVRPVREMPGVITPFSGRDVDIVVVRENVEDLYAGIEHMQTPDVAQCLKLMSRGGCERIVRTAFELAVAQGRTTVHCATKANIMKLTEGMLKSVFEEVAAEYPDITAEHIIIDNAAHQLVRFPEEFDVIVTTNMNGDILSDLTSGLVGGLGFAPSANLGTEVAIFEAVHGSAPKYAGKDAANPSAVLMSAIMMLRHLELFDQATDVEQAIAVTLEQGIRTRDVSGPEGAVGTQEFADAVIANLGKRSEHWLSRNHAGLKLPVISREEARRAPGSRTKVGVDVFVETADSPVALGEALTAITVGTPYTLKMISNRGTVVYPPTGTGTECVDHFRCRFVISDSAAWNQESVLGLLQKIGARYRWMHVEKLEVHDGAPGYTLAQGEN